MSPVERPNDEWEDAARHVPRARPVRARRAAAPRVSGASGYKGADFWAVVCDHTTDKPTVGVLPPAALRAALDGPWTSTGMRTSATAMPSGSSTRSRGAVAEAGAYRPEPSGVFPDDWDLPDEGQWKVERDRDSETSGDSTSRAMTSPTDRSGAGRPRGHEADWGQSFLAGGPAGDNPTLWVRRLGRRPPHRRRVGSGSDVLRLPVREPG